MMAIETKPFDAADYLNAPEDVASYLDVWLEDGTPDEIKRALSDIARSKGMAAIAEAAGMKRESLYKALGEKGNPTLVTLSKVLDAMGLRLSVSPKEREPA